MIVKYLISTFSRFAVSRALLSGFELNPRICALAVRAMRTSFSVMAPTPDWSTFAFTLLLSIFSIDCLIASAEP